jgi:hypothetical protein
MGSIPNITPQLRNFGVNFGGGLWEHILKCVIWLLSLLREMLRAMGRPIRIERLIQDFLYVGNLAKRRKYLVRISAYMI